MTKNMFQQQTLIKSFCHLKKGSAVEDTYLWETELSNPDKPEPKVIFKYFFEGI